MRELDKITLTVTRISYVFDESEFEKGGANKHSIKGERTIVKADGDVYYDRYVAAHLIAKRPAFGSPVDCFWNNMIQRFPKEKPYCCGNVSHNACNRIHLVRKRRLEVFNLKKQFFNVRLKQFFSRFKASFGKQFGRFKK